MRLLTIFLFINFLILNAYGEKEGAGPYILAVSKKDYVLYVIRKTDKAVLEKFPVGLGKNPGRKLIAGDEKTPEGIYYITEILKESDEKLKKMNSIYWKAKDGHFFYGFPNKDLGKNVYGPRFIRFSYPNEEDKKLFQQLKKEGKIPKNAAMSPWIAIHGTNDPASIGKNASSGCVRMLNSDIQKLDPYIQIGTQIIIQEYFDPASF